MQKHLNNQVKTAIIASVRAPRADEVRFEQKCVTSVVENEVAQSRGI